MTPGRALSPAPQVIFYVTLCAAVVFLSFTGPVRDASAPISAHTASPSPTAPPFPPLSSSRHPCLIQTSMFNRRARAVTASDRLSQQIAPLDRLPGPATGDRRPCHRYRIDQAYLYLSQGATTHTHARAHAARTRASLRARALARVLAAAAAALSWWIGYPDSAGCYLARAQIGYLRPTISARLTPRGRARACSQIFPAGAATRRRRRAAGSVLSGQLSGQLSGRLSGPLSLRARLPLRRPAVNAALRWIAHLAVTRLARSSLVVGLGNRASYLWRGVGDSLSDPACAR